MHRNCKSSITISKDNILKILIKNNNENIEIKKGKNNHTCAPINSENKNIEINTNLILTNNEIKELDIKLIIQHIEKPLSFHIDNLKKNKVPFKRYRITNLLQKYREEAFPEDMHFLNKGGRR